MVFSAKSSSNINTKNNNNNNEGNWGMGFLLILFHHHPDDNNSNNHTNHNQFTKKKASFSLSSSSSFATKSTNLLLSKTQSTLSICGLLVFTTLLLFTLSTFEPSSVLHHHHHHTTTTTTTTTTSRRFLQQGSKNYGNAHERFGVNGLFSGTQKGTESNFTRIIATPALQGMGALFLRGTKAMTDLVVGHVPEDTTQKEIVSFFRVLQHSGMLCRVDFVFVFASPLSAMRFGRVVEGECRSFLRLVQLAGERRFAESGRVSYGLTRYLKGTGEGEKVPMWGKRRANLTESTRASYGSVVGFEVGELDPEGSLSGFLDHVTMSSRRWAGYPMLLGRVRRQFKHMMLVNVKTTLILSDPFSRVRNRSSESLFLWSNPDAELVTPTRHHGKRNSGKSSKSQLNSDHTTSVMSPGVPKTRSSYNADVVVGGSRGVRRFATAALTEIVRGVVERKGKGRSSLTESGLVNQVLRSGHLLKNINLITPTESIPELNSLAGFNSSDSDSGSSFLKLSENFSVVQRGHSSGGSGGSLDIDSVVMREICASHKIYSSVYSDCLATSQ